MIIKTALRVPLALDQAWPEPAPLPLKLAKIIDFNYCANIIDQKFAPWVRENRSLSDLA